MNNFEPKQSNWDGVHHAVQVRLSKRGPNIARAITIVFSVFLCGATVWASTTQVPGLIRADGEITAQGALRKVEHLHGGTVETVFVAEGQQVKAGDIIAQLSPESINIQIEQLLDRNQATAATIHRLKVLMSDLPEDPTPTSKLIPPGDGLRLQKAQLKLRMARREAAARLIRDRAAAIKTIREVRETASQRVEASKRSFRSYEILSERGIISPMQLGRHADERDALVSELLRANVELSAANSLHVSAQNEYDDLILSEQEDTLQLLNEAIDEQTELQHTLKELELRREQLTVRAPIDGVVHALNIDVPGEVVAPGDQIAELLPTGVLLNAELRVDAKNIGQIALDDDVAITVTTYARNKYGQVTGKIAMISPTSISKPDESPYFKVIVELDEQTIGFDNNKAPLRAGLIIQGEIVTVTRTVAEYLLKPLEATLNKGLSEK